MTGIFDSGAGGLAALRELRRLSPEEDILFLADVKNAPYGTKSKSEIADLASENIKKLRRAGAERILIACCTASTVYPLLEEEDRRVALPIIEPAAKRAAAVTKNGRIAVIATSLTAKSLAFSSSLTGMDPNIKVMESEAQPLVGLAEAIAHGAPLTSSSREKIKRALTPVLSFGADTLILGCTHFSHLEDEIRRITKNIYTVDSAKVGAECMAKCTGRGLGETVFL